jgi:hypothetical protein
MNNSGILISGRTATLATFIAVCLGAGCSSDPSLPTSDPTDAGAPDASPSDGGAPDAPASDLSDALFDPERVLEVSISMAPADWDTLRYQTRKVTEVLGEGCLDGPKASPYTYFPATVTVDGEPLPMSAVRKKGFLGSASITKPSLKVSFDEYVPGREYSGVEGLTLNNSQQDPSLLKTCLAFKLFRDAGLPASRCTFARVTVNGNYVGVYANVEAVGKRLLKRFFADETGNLYEGQISDFRPGWSATYEKKTNEANPDRSDLDAVTAALQAPDADLEAALGKVLDINEFMRFWAMEALIAAWDGYASNLNNHFVYGDPGSGKMAFLPWGPDMSFDASDFFHPPNRPQSVSAKGAVAFRLYSIPAMRERYVEEMKALLKDVWKEDEILAEIDRVQALLSPHVGAGAPVFEGAGSAVEGFVTGRRAVIEGEIGAGPALWPFPLPSTACLSTLGTVSGTFSTAWGTQGQNPFMAGTGTFDFAIPADKKQAGSPVGAVAGWENESKERSQVAVAGSFPDGKVRLLIFNVHPDLFKAGTDAPFDWQSVFGAALDATQQGVSPVLIGLFGDGQLHLDKAAIMPGAPVSGSFSATVVGFTP